MIIERAKKCRGIGPKTRWMDSSETESVPSVFCNIVATINIFVCCNPPLVKIIIFNLINGKEVYGLVFKSAESGWDGYNVEKKEVLDNDCRTC